MEKMVVVYGNHGKLFADPVNGAILKRQGPDGEKEHGGNNGLCDECRETEIAYPEIDYFDFNDITVPIKWEIVIENGKALELGHMNIARVGYTLNNGEYIKPSTLFLWNAEGSE